MLIKNLLAPNKRALWLAVLWTVLILYFSFKAPSVERKVYFPNADKIAHFVFYFVFVIVWFRYFYLKKGHDFKGKFLLFLVAVLLGIGVEFGQHFLTTSRQGDVSDAVANTIGSLIGIIVVSSVFKMKKIK